MREGVKIQTKINKTNHQKTTSSSPPTALLSIPKNLTKERAKKQDELPQKESALLSTTYMETGEAETPKRCTPNRPN